MDYKKILKCISYYSGPWETAGDDTQYIIEFNKKTKEAIVVFCGSNSDVDWKANFSFWKKPYKDMGTTFYVHAGFLKRWKAARDVIMDQLESLNPKSIIITGHSYGGAIALLCMEDCWFRFIHSRENQDNSLEGKIHCYTFGAPRILGIFNYKKIKDRWNGSVEFFNASDVVACVPPACFLYRHPVKRTHIGEKYSFFKMIHSRSYHDIDAYEDSIKKLMTEE